MAISGSEPANDPLVVASLDLLETAMQAFNDYHERVGEGPDAKCALVDFQREAERNIGPDGHWVVDYGSRLTDRSLIYMTVSRNYLASIYFLVQNYPNGPGVAPLARCVSEACGKMAWLLDNRLGTHSHARERVARLLLDEADDASRRKTLAVGLNHPDRARAGDDYRLARDLVTKPGVFWGGEITVDARGDVTVRAQRLPKTSHFVVLAEEILSKGSREAQHVYGYLSALTHPTAFAYLESLAARDLIFCAKLVNYAVLALHNEMRLHSGWTQADPAYFPEGDRIKERHDALNAMISQQES